MALRAVFTPRSAASMTNVASALLVVVALGASAAHGREAAARGPGASAVLIPAGPEAIEQAFWACDYAAATRWVGLEEGAACVKNYEELKRAKFAGSSDALLAWWLRNKATEHRAQAAQAADRGAVANR